MKRGLDIVIALLALPVLLSVLIPTAVVNRCTGTGPAIFRQTRYGFDGKPFSIFKIKTMRAAEDGSAFRQTTPEDNRVTWYGRILRATSVDELPQILNVLYGEMSIVGPRPHPILLDERFRGEITDYDRRYLVKPGITGLAQVRGYRGPTETVAKMKKRIDSDLEYVERTSVWLDLQILLRTVSALIGRKNAV